MRNPQSLKGARKRGRAPKQQKAARKFISKKVTVDAIEFDSATEAAYYQHLKRNQSIKMIEIQPKFQIIKPYSVTCKRCGGSGKRPSPQTGNLINCTLCRGMGKRDKSGAIYTADFKVTYIDGYVEVIDVKGGPTTRDFPLRRRLFEIKTGQELIIVRLKDKEWVRE